MPLKKCTVDGKPGWQWGSQGKCYTGPNAKKDAVKQGVAIEGPEKFSQKAIEQNISLDTKDVATVAEWMYDNSYDNVAVVATVSTLSLYIASGKTKKEWDKINKKELKRDTKKEQKEHEKDAIKDDKEKLKRLKKDEPSEKKKREVKDLKKDERYDKRDAKSASDEEEYRRDKREMDSETLREQLKHHKDAVKNLEREIKDLEKDKREDEKDIRKESGATKAIYEGYRTTSMFMDRLGYGHFHTLTKNATHTSKARTSFGDIIITGHTHDIVNGKIVAAKDQEGHTHTHEIKDIGPGDGWVYGS